MEQTVDGLKGVDTDFCVQAIHQCCWLYSRHVNAVADRCALCPFLLRRWCEGGGGHLRVHRDKVHQWWIHERQRPGPQRLPRWDCGAAVAHQVPVLPAGAFPQVSHGEAPCAFPVVCKVSYSSFNVRRIRLDTWTIGMCWIQWILILFAMMSLLTPVTTRRTTTDPSSPDVTTDKASDWRITSSSTCTSAPPPVETPASSLLTRLEWRVSGISTQRRAAQCSVWPDEDLTVRSSECLCLCSLLSQIRETDTRTERPAGSSAPRSSPARGPSRSAPVTPSRRGTGFSRGRGCSPCPAATRSPGLFHCLDTNLYVCFPYIHPMHAFKIHEWRRNTQWVSGMQSE